MNNSNIIKLIVAVVFIGAIGFFAVANTRSSQPNNINSVSQSNNTFDTSSQTNVAGIKVGDIAPDFSFQTIEGKTVTLSSLRGQPVSVSFVLTTGCATCIIGAMHIRDAQKLIPFKVIMLAISPDETVSDLQNFKNLYGSSDLLIGFDKGDEISSQYQVHSAGPTYVADANGKIIYKGDAYTIDTESLVNTLRKL